MINEGHPSIKEGHILVVDDSPLYLEMMQHTLQTQGHRPVLARSGTAALQLLSPCIDLVLLDVHMPDMDGFEVTRRIRKNPEYGDVPIIMVTALASQEDRLDAVEAGANDFLTKPVDNTELKVRTTSLLKMRAAQNVIKRHQTELEVLVRERTAELQETLNFLVSAEQQAQQAYRETTERLVIAAEYKDQHTAAHIHRVRRYCGLLAQLLQLPETQIDLITQASAMHDVGKLGIPDSILTNTGKLTDEERQIMQQHTLIGGRILCNSSSPLLQAGESMALTHHEKWDGSGYPYGLEGEQIPLASRICAIADVFDALTTARPYNPAFSNMQAVTILLEGRAKHFDPLLLDLFLSNMDQVRYIQQCYGLENYGAEEVDHETI